MKNLQTLFIILRARSKASTVLISIGVLFMGAGSIIFVPPLIGVAQRSGADQKALQNWQDPGAALSKQLPKIKTVLMPGSSPIVTAPICGTGVSNTSYALIDFPSLPGIEGVADNGNWSLLLSRSVVHYSTTPAPGQQGNGVYGLHREPNFEPLGTLQVGNSIVITASNCQQYTYKITNIWTEYPSSVTQLNSIGQGSWITILTCTPLWVDYERLVIRAQLQS